MNRPRILILDDEKLIRWTLVQILTQDGYAVDAAASTDEARRLCQAEPYDLVLADLEVCGAGAQAFFAELGNRSFRPPVVILSALALEQAERRLDDYQAVRIMEKPFDLEIVRTAVRAVLKSRNTE